MSSGFVTGGISNANDDGKHSPPRTQDSWERAEEAIKLAQWQQEEQSRGRDGEKSLYEILQANKGKPHPMCGSLSRNDQERIGTRVHAKLTGATEI